MVSWTQKYAPKRRSEIVGNIESVNSIVGYLNRFRNPDLELKKRALLLYGPPGIGKTSSVIAIAKSLKFDVFTVNASDQRNKLSLQSVKQASMFNSLKESLNKQIIGKILLIDEIDGLSGTADRGGIREIIEIIHDTRAPIILTANDISDQKFNTLKKYCELREFFPPSSKEILDIMRRISEKESIEVTDLTLYKLIELSENDIRGSINSLQTIATGTKNIAEEDLEVLSKRDRSILFTEFLNILFIDRDGDLAHKQTKMLSNMDYSKLLFLIRDLLPKFINPSDYQQNASIYEVLARADLALTRAQSEQIWSQLSYFYTFLTKELATLVPSGSNFPTLQEWQLQIPSYWITLSRQKKPAKIGSKVGLICHVSTQEAISFYFPYLRIIFNKDSNLAAHLAIDFKLFDTEPGKKKEKIIWNGEIDYFSTDKTINREIKKKIRELYPQIERITSLEVERELLKEIQEQHNQAKQKIREEKRNAENNKKRRTGKEKTKEKPLKDPSLEKKQFSQKKIKTKSLSDFF
ncbi:AAA family ATPase [Candidatus Hodarchaeum mangrovi]